MRTKILAALGGVVVAVGAVSWSVAPVPMKAADATPQMTSIGPLTFGPDAVLFAADNQAASIHAIDLGAAASGGAPGAQGIDAIDQKIAALLGTDATEIIVTDLAVHPRTGNAYLSVMRGQGTASKPALLRVDGAGKIEVVGLDSLKHSQVSLPNAPEAGANPQRDPRRQTVTDMAFTDGRLYIAGLSNEEFASKLRSVKYPFAAADPGTSVEIFHGNHGQFETRSPVFAFVPYRIGNTPHLVAAYLCTPLVKFPVASLQPGTKVVGTTIAELGNRNRPVDMIVYKKDGHEFLLMANTARGVMKIPTDGFASASPITAPVKSETSGVAYETVAAMKGIEQLDLLDANRIDRARARGGGRSTEPRRSAAAVSPRSGRMMAVQRWASVGWATAVAVLMTGACVRQPAAGGPPHIRLVHPPEPGGSQSIEVTRPEPGVVRAASRLDARGPWPRVLAVHVVRPDGTVDDTAIAGRYEAAGDALRFTPLFPFDAGRTYEVRYDASTLLPDAAIGPRRAVVVIPAAAAGPATVVTEVFPSGELVPANQLRMYITFSAPMGRRGGLAHVRLLDHRGRTVEDPFLQLDADLWNRDRTRYTLLFDPGRQKRGFCPIVRWGRRSSKAGATPWWWIASGSMAKAGRSGRRSSARFESVRPIAGRSIPRGGGSRRPPRAHASR